ncbi:MAG: T9SS type A sorting domain-containing protein [Gemmatimonadota bacterium]|nr:T9SS type A sorting domain-containing protein [Gemmatimonadota bacterium]
MTAQQVEDGSASLREFGLEARNRFSQGAGSREVQLYVGCVLRQEGSHLYSGSTYLVQLTPDGRVFIHAKNMALSGRLLNRLIYGAILRALEIDVAGLQDDPAALTAAFLEAAGRDGGEFNVPAISGASGYAAVYFSRNFRLPIVLLAGFDLDESHLVEEEIDYGIPAVTARDVVDRETLKAFVTQAGEAFLNQQKGGDLSATSKARVALRDPKGPWRHGSVYLYVLDLTSNIILFHGAFPDRYELRPLVATVRDVVTGKLVLPQVIEAAKSSPEGGFVDYYFDDPTDDTDSADIPKVGYARQFTGQREREDGTVLPINFIVGSGFYGRAADVAPGPSTVVEATVLGGAVEGLDVAFSRAVAGRGSDYAWSAVTDAAGLLSLTISSADGVSGYYRARATNPDGDVVGQWSSIPLNEGRRQSLELTLGGSARVVRVVSLDTSEPVAAAKPAFAAEAAPEASGLSPNSPNPFNSATLITYHLSGTGPVTLVIYNVLGQPVRTLVDESRPAGSYQVRWDARDDTGAMLSTGVYIARLSYPGGVATQRLLYLK